MRNYNVKKLKKFGEGSSETENNINKLKRLLYVQN